MPESTSVRGTKCKSWRLLSKDKGLWVFGMFWHGCPCMPNRHKPIGTTEEKLLIRYEETNRWWKKLKMQVIQLFQSGGASLENCCEKILALKMNLVCTLTWRTLHLIVGTHLTGVEPRPQKHITETIRRRKLTFVDVIILYPYVCKYGKFPVCHP